MAFLWLLNKNMYVKCPTAQTFEKHAKINIIVCLFYLLIWGLNEKLSKPLIKMSLINLKYHWWQNYFSSSNENFFKTSMGGAIIHQGSKPLSFYFWHDLGLLDILFCFLIYYDHQGIGKKIRQSKNKTSFINPVENDFLRQLAVPK